MLEDELVAVAERVAPPVREDLADSVLARLDAPSPLRRRRAVAAVAAAALVAGLGLSPQVRAAAVDLLQLVGIELSGDRPDSSPDPAQPLPGSRGTDLGRAAADAAFPVSVPASLGEPGQVRVADAGRVVSMQWRDGDLVLDQFDGRLGPVFEKQVGGVEVQDVDVDGVPAWWVAGPHDLMYVDRDGEVVHATARLAGRTLFWETPDEVTVRLEGERLTRREAVALARSLVAVPGTG
jgi:hypothetical protein